MFPAGPSWKQLIGFPELFYRKLVCDAGVFLEASSQLVEAESKLDSVTSWASKHGVEGACNDDRYSPATYAMLEGHRNKARDSGLCNAFFEDWVCDTAIVNLKQTSHFAPKANFLYMPTLLRGSLLYDLVRKRTVLLAEHWLMQGFPHPDIEALPQYMRGEFPFTALVTTSTSTGSQPALSTGAQRSLTGNAMHVSQVGLWFLYNICRPGVAK